MGNITALVGAQYGSEGKGGVVYHLANEFDVHVRTGAPNAGHTIYHEDRQWKMRQIPCGWVNPNAYLVIGAGAIVDPILMREEIEAIEEVHGLGFITERLVVDRKAAILSHTRHQKFEGGVTGTAHRMIGSTGEGVGPCRMARIARGTIRDWAWAKLDLIESMADELRMTGDIAVGDTVSDVNRYIDQGYNVLLEGTQGSGLSLIHGSWPYVTSADTNAGQLCTDAGISPRLLSHIILVARTHPIRVWGNSGPLPNETSWEKLGVDPETTTVTLKQRRVANFDHVQFHQAVVLNRPCDVILTFLDYIGPEDKSKESWSEISEESKNWIYELESKHSIGVIGVTTGPTTIVWRGYR